MDAKLFQHKFQRLTRWSPTRMLCYCRNVRPTWVKFNSKDTKESGVVFEVLSTKSDKGT